MKKVTVIAILVVYVASIAVVNFFGLEIKQFDGISYVEKIECNTITVQNGSALSLQPKQNLNGVPLFIFDFIPAPEDDPYSTEDESIVKNPNVVQLDYKAMPETADETGVKFEYDEEAAAGFIEFHKLSKTFVFLQPNRILTVTIKAIDGKNANTTIAIMGRIPKNINTFSGGIEQ